MEFPDSGILRKCSRSKCSSFLRVSYLRGYFFKRVAYFLKADQQKKMSAPEWKPEGSIFPLFERALAGNKWAGTNSSTAGPRTEKEASVGDADFQLYSLATPVSLTIIRCQIDWAFSSLKLPIIPNT